MLHLLREGGVVAKFARILRLFHNVNGIRLNKQTDGCLGFFSNFSPVLTKVTFLDDVKNVPKDGFYNCGQLRHIELPEGIETIGESAFYDCTALEQIVLPNSLTAIHDMAFRNCSNLKQIVFRSMEESKLAEIMPQAFCMCTSLKKLELPGSLRTIEESAFDCCTNLVEVRIAEGCTKIGEDAFKDIDAPNRVFYLPASICEIGNEAIYSWKTNTIYSPKNSVIENYCRSQRCCVWNYIPSEAERKAQEEEQRRQQAEQARKQKQAAIADTKGNITRMQQELEAAIAGKAKAAENLEIFIVALREQEALLPTLTGMFAGGKRKKCQEQMETFRHGAYSAQNDMEKCEATIARCTEGIAQAEAKLQKLLSEE